MTAGSIPGGAVGTRVAAEPGDAGIVLRLSQDADADALLSRDPFALLIGMLLDQQVPMEKAFVGPHVISNRLGRDLDAADVAARDPVEFAGLFAATPAVHRFPVAMAARVQALAAYLAEHYGGDSAKVWREAPNGVELRARLQALPGFGDQKARIFIALLGKRLGVTPDGWREACDPYGVDGVHRSVADVTGPESLAAVRADKRKRKAALKRTTETPSLLNAAESSTARDSTGGKRTAAGKAAPRTAGRKGAGTATHQETRRTT